MTALGELIADRYVVTALVGSGGMADVYRAHDQVLDRDVAVKVLRLNTADPSSRQRFASEARTLAKLNHPGLVTVLDAGIDAERPYLVMELVEGPTLSQYVRESGPLTDHEARVIGGQLADAIAHAHEQGVIHRDVKPSNILLRTDGRVVLSDFGIAQMLSSTVQHTRTGDVIGSPAYLAPEQVNGGSATAAVDVYALGLVLLESLTGQRTYDGPPIEAAIARLTTPPAFPTSIPRDLRSLLQQMTALAPETRPDARTVAASLSSGPGLAPVPTAPLIPVPAAPEAAEATAGLALAPAAAAGMSAGMSAVTSTTEMEASDRKRRGLLAGLVAAAVAALVLGGVGFAQLHPDEVAAAPPPSESATPTPTATPTAAATAKAVVARAATTTHVTKKPVRHHVVKKVRKAPRPPKHGPAKGHGHGKKRH